MDENELQAELEAAFEGFDLLVPRHIAWAVAKIVAQKADARARRECAALCRTHGETARASITPKTQISTMAEMMLIDRVARKLWYDILSTIKEPAS